MFRPMSNWKDHRFAEMIGHLVEISVSCGCTKVSVCRPRYFIDQLGKDATPRDAERRMKCRTCKQRAVLTLGRQWAVDEGRDGRVDPPPLPEWMGLG